MTTNGKMIGTAARGADPDPEPAIVRTLLVLLALLLGVVAGLVGGILASVAGSVIAGAFAIGGVTFAGTVTLVLVIEKSLALL